AGGAKLSYRLQVAVRVHEPALWSRMVDAAVGIVFAPRRQRGGVMGDPVSLSRSNGILEVVLDRPKANAIDGATSRRLGEVFAAFRDDPDLHVAIVTGAGDRIFSAGWDLKAAAEHGESEDTDQGIGGFAGLTEMFDLYKPVIAAVNGLAIGGGF